MRKPPSTWEIFLIFLRTLIWIGAISFILLCIHRCNVIDKLHERNCRVDHGEEPYMEEEDFGKTKDGCTITKLTKMRDDCYPSGDYVYVTNCRSVSWDERTGKSTTRRTNLNGE